MSGDDPAGGIRHRHVAVDDYRRIRRVETLAAEHPAFLSAHPFARPGAE
jgi:hypothetical protein